MSDAFYLGKKYFEEGHLEDAISQFEFSLIENKFHWKAYYHLAESCLNLGRERHDGDLFLKGYQSLQSLHSLNPGYHKREVRLLKGEIEESMKQCGLAVFDDHAIAEAAIATDPHEAGAHHQISSNLNEGPRTRIIRFQKIIDSDPANLIALGQLAKAHRERGEYRAAQGVLERMLRFALSLEFDLYSSEENLSASIRWWADNADTGQAERETVELLSAFCELARILYHSGEISKSALITPPRWT